MGVHPTGKRARAQGDITVDIVGMFWLNRQAMYVSFVYNLILQMLTFVAVYILLNELLSMSLLSRTDRPPLSYSSWNILTSMHEFNYSTRVDYTLG